MAEYALIDGYLSALRTQVRWRRDVEDLVAEVEDHLYSTVERFEARGADTDLAQRKTLDRFGDPDLMAEAFASTPRGGIAVPTKFTKTAGTAALAASILWVLAAVSLWLGVNISDWNGTFIIFVAFVVGAGAMTLMTTAGLRERHGGLGWLGVSGLVIASLGVASTFIIAWAMPLWMTVQGVGYLMVALAMFPIGVAPRVPSLAYGSGMLLGSVAWGIARALEVGRVDEWGDYPTAFVIGGGVGFVVTAAGLLGIGLWLRNEEPAELDVAGGPAVTA